MEYTLENQSSGESEKGEITDSSLESVSTEEGRSGSIWRRALWRQHCERWYRHEKKSKCSGDRLLETRGLGMKQKVWICQDD